MFNDPLIAVPRVTLHAAQKGARAWPADLNRAEALLMGLRKPTRIALLLVLVPFLAVAMYLVLLAGDRYEAEARFVVRKPASAMTLPDMSSMLPVNLGGGPSAEDTHLVGAYLTSENAMARLLQSADLTGVMARPEADMFWSFPGLFSGSSAVARYQRYRDLVNFTFDTSSGIGTLKVQAFRGADAYAIARALLDDAESQVNSLSRRSREDAITTALTETERAQAEVIAAQDRLTAFRKREEMVDPAIAVKTASMVIGQLAVERAEAEAQLTALQNSQTSSPAVQTLKDRIAALDAQIAEERKRLAGGDSSLAPRIAEFERLSIELLFARKLFAAAVIALEDARRSSARQDLYLERIVEPQTPDRPVYPSRLLWLALLLTGAAFLVYVIRMAIEEAEIHASETWDVHR